MLRMTLLAESFPSLARFPGVRPWDPDLLAMQFRCASSGERHAIRFVLGVWNSTSGANAARKKAFKMPPFDVFEAMACWDEKHLGAFLEWARAPWFA